MMKMTPPVPEGVATSDRPESGIDTLKLFDGVPDVETAQRVYKLNKMED